MKFYPYYQYVSFTKNKKFQYSIFWFTLNTHEGIHDVVQKIFLYMHHINIMSKIVVLPVTQLSQDAFLMPIMFLPIASHLLFMIGLTNVLRFWWIYTSQPLVINLLLCQRLEWILLLARGFSSLQKVFFVPTRWMTMRKKSTVTIKPACLPSIG